jgi:hypothetical protein
VVMVPVPLTRVHKPVPVDGVFPARVKLAPHILAVTPALDAVGASTPVIVTWAKLGEQGLLEIVHWKTFGPAPNPLTAELGNAALAIIPLPLTSVHTPVPTIGVFPLRVALVPQTLCAIPASATVGEVTPVSVTWEELEAQGGLEIVH